MLHYGLRHIIWEKRFQYGDKLISKDAEFVSVSAALTADLSAEFYTFFSGLSEVQSL